MARSKRKPTPTLTKTGVEVVRNYCRVCREHKAPLKFYSAIDNVLDTNGLFSVCKECCLEIFDTALNKERMFERAMLYTCRTLNVMYHEDSVMACKASYVDAQEQDRKPRPPFSMYMSRINGFVTRQLTGDGDMSIDMTYNRNENVSMPEEDVETEREDMNLFWGSRYTLVQIEYLEHLFEWYAKYYEVDEPSASFLVRQICKKMLAIRELEMESKSSSLLEKEVMNMMTRAGVSPDSVSAVNAGKIKDSFGVWTAEIEKYGPADWLTLQEDKGKRDVFYDVDDMERHGENFLRRPIRNYHTGVPDMNIIDADGEMVDGSV